MTSVDNYVKIWAIYDAEGAKVVGGPDKEADL